MESGKVKDGILRAITRKASLLLDRALASLEETETEASFNVKCGIKMKNTSTRQVEVKISADSKSKEAEETSDAELVGGAQLKLFDLPEEPASEAAEPLPSGKASVEEEAEEPEEETEKPKEEEASEFPSAEEAEKEAGVTV